MAEFRPMRRHKQQLSSEEVDAILRRGTSGVLAVHGDEGYPYAVPLSYVYDGNAIYFHCAREGHKLDAIKANDKVSFCVIDADDVVPAEYTTYFRSVIVFGRATIMNDDETLRAALEMLGDKYNPGQDEALEDEIAGGIKRLHMVRIDIDHVTGKEAIELVRGMKPSS